MFWVKLTFWLFGWHWVVLKFAGEDIYRRIKFSPVKRAYVEFYGQLMFLDEPTRPFRQLTWVGDAFQAKDRMT